MLLLWSSVYSRRLNKTEPISYKGFLHFGQSVQKKRLSNYNPLHSSSSSVVQFAAGNDKCQCPLVECPFFVLPFLVTNWLLYVGHCTPLRPGTLTFVLHTSNISKMQLFCLHKYIYSLHFLYNKSTILNTETQTLKKNFLVCGITNFH